MGRRRATRYRDPVEACPSDVPVSLRGLTRAELIRVISRLQTELAPAPQDRLEKVLPVRAQTMLVNGSVRSGQTVDFGEGDIIVVGSVGSGAEISAGGSIHIYGALRGKARAGTDGGRGARIFCQRLEAELLRIGDVCRLSDDLEENLRGRPAHAWLESNQMALAALSTAPEETHTRHDDQARTGEPARGAQPAGWLAWARRLIAGASEQTPAVGA